MNQCVEDLISKGQIEAVPFSENRVASELAMAKQHLVTSRMAFEKDPAGSFQLSYDAARKALQAVLANQGLRVKQPPYGNHYTFVLITRCGLVDQEIWQPLNWLRSQRNTFQYDVTSPEVSVHEDARQAIGHVSRMLLKASQLIERAANPS